MCLFVSNFFTLVKSIFSGFVYLVLSGRVQIMMDFNTKIMQLLGRENEL